MNRDNSLIAFAIFFSFSLFFFSAISKITYSATDASNVVINEVQISGSSASDEFVELFNPTDTAIDMSGWRLTRFSSTGTESNLDSSISGVINPNSYYLIAHPNYDGEVLSDEVYSTQNNISSNGAVRLYSDAGITPVDTVGFGTGVIFETQSVDNPVSNGSFSRTAALDTDSNFSDFIFNETSDPQNSASISASPSPTPTSTPSATPTPSIEPSSEPSTTPTTTPTPSESSTPIATPLPSVSPTPTPTSTSTAIPSPSPSVTPTPVPTETPSSVVRTRFLARFGSRVCSLEYRYVNFGFRRIAFPRIVCR